MTSDEEKLIIGDLVQKLSRVRQKAVCLEAKLNDAAEKIKVAAMRMSDGRYYHLVLDEYPTQEEVLAIRDEYRTVRDEKKRIEAQLKEYGITSIQ